MSKSKSLKELIEEFNCDNWNKIKLSNLVEFDKEFKKLCKEYRSLYDDFRDFLKVLVIEPRWNILIEGLWEDVRKNGEFYKAKKFRCRSISKNSVKSWIRIIYRYSENEKIIEFAVIEFIEIYHKNKKANNDYERLKKAKN